MLAARDFIVFCIVYLLLLPFRILPYGASLALGRLLARALYPLAKKYRRIADENLKHAFPERDEAWRKTAVRRCLDHIGVVLADAAYGGRRDDRFLKKYVVFEGDSKEVERRAFARGTGMMLIAGHLGLWEMLVWYTGFVVGGGGIYKAMSNRFMDSWYKKIREASGIVLFELADTALAVRHVRKGGAMGIVPDQNAGMDGLFIDFLNRPASTFRGPALIADLANAGMLLYTALHMDDGKIHVTITDLGHVDRSAFRDREEAVRHYTEIWVRALEERIREHPEQYFWVHQRWKTRPEDVQRYKEQRQKEKEQKS